MNEGVLQKIADWSEEKLTGDELLVGIEQARPDLETHHSEFQKVVDELTASQAERCAELITFCFSLLESTRSNLDTIVEAVKENDRNAVFIAGDQIGRNRFQLNQAFAEFRNQALMALGPSDIPNLNLLLSRQMDYLEDPSEEHALLFKEALDAERIVVYHGLEDLAKEPDLPEVATLINAFRAHMARLNKIAEALESQKDAADYDELFEGLEQGFLELQELVPMVQMKLRNQGVTDFPDINYLLGLIEDAAQGATGDAPLLDALEAVEESFLKTKEQLSQGVEQLDSALAKDEVEAVLETFEEFEEGIEAVYSFLEERDRAWLVEAKGCLLEFARRFTAHQETMKELEEKEGQVVCAMCSTANDVSRSRCSKCGGPLPQNVAITNVSTFETKEQIGNVEPRSNEHIGANVAKLLQAVNGVADGSLNHTDFLGELDRFQNVIEANLNAVPEKPHSEEEKQQKALDNVYQVFDAGIEKLRRGLDLMRSYPNSQDEELLSQAVVLVDEGAKAVFTAGQVVKP